MPQWKNVVRNNREIIALFTGIVLVVGSFSVYEMHDPTPVTDQAIHVHADFLIYIHGERLDLTADTYQSSIEQILHEDFHFHDNKDNIIHRHDAGLTLAEFMSSLGFILTDTCFTTDTPERYCSNDENELQLFVNSEVISEIATYIPQEEDKILLYFGAPDDPELERYLAEITDESCIYSGNCPERGTPPPESCGLTCEI